MQSVAPDWTQVIIAFVALGGFGISIYNLIHNIKRDKRGMKISIAYGYKKANIGISTPKYSDLVTHLIIKIANSGLHPVTIDSIFSQLTPKHRIGIPVTGGTIQLPYELQIAKDVPIFIDIAEVAKAIKEAGKVNKFAIKVSDNLGKVYKSNKLKFDLNRYLKNHPYKT